MSDGYGIGCEHCDGLGYYESGSGRVWISGGDVYEDIHLEPCPNCTPPDAPEREYTDDEESAALAELEVAW